MKIRSILCLGLIQLAGGCFNETRTYTLSVHNDLNAPISVCMTKLHSPDEEGWESPEDIALPPHPATDEVPPGMVIPPGKTLNSPPLSGTFDRDFGRAFLRVYYGKLTLSQMIAVSPGSINRLDVPLVIGPNHLDIKRDSNGLMTAEPMPPAASTDAATAAHS